jgi:hypothetical protein
MGDDFDEPLMRHHCSFEMLLAQLLLNVHALRFFVHDVFICFYSDLDTSIWRADIPFLYAALMP